MKELKSPRDQTARHDCKARTVVGRGGEKRLLCDPRSESRLGGREQKKGHDHKWDEWDGKQKEKEKKLTQNAQKVVVFF